VPTHAPGAADPAALFAAFMAAMQGPKLAAAVKSAKDANAAAGGGGAPGDQNGGGSAQ
jgi:hypothetical protein